MNETLIISMTSYPARINCVAKVWFSILRQNVDKSLYHCVLVLAEPEFPNKEKDLPEDLKLLIENDLVELIWHPTNIRSHKKLIPTLLKYPNNPILIIDDDVIRPAEFLETFLNDHAEYPNDIIAGAIYNYLNDNKFVRYKNKRKCCLDFGKIIKNGRPANGCGGLLYPPHTFNDPRFFDEALFMRLSPTSDETWQFFFNYKEHKQIRLISKDIDCRQYMPGTQELKTALYKVNSKKYNDIWQNLLNNLG